MHTTKEVGMVRWLMIGICCIVSWYGCGSLGGGGPETVVKKFYTALKNQDYETAVSCYTPSTLKDPGAKEKMVGMLKAHVTSKEGIKSFDITGSEIEGDHAVVTYTLTYKNNTSESDTDVNCVKEGGSWYMKLQ